MHNMRTRLPAKKTKPRRIWPATAAAALALAIACVFLLAAQRQLSAQSDTRGGLGRLSVDYELVYKPDSLYSQPKPADKEARLLAYIDHVIWKPSYQMAGFDGLSADYEYSVAAHLVAHAAITNQYIDPDFIVWQKDYELVKPTQIPSGTSAGCTPEQVSTDINQYIAFCMSVYEKTQVPTNNELKLVFNVKATVHGPLGDTVDNNTVEMVVPIIDNLLVVTGTPVTENKLDTKAAPSRPAPNYTPWGILCGFLALLMLAATAFMGLRGKVPENKNTFAKATARIFKQYGDRLVRLENPLPYQHLATISIDGIEEIIKIADEINQPAFYYKVDTVEEKKIEFYVFDAGRVYYMVIFGEMGMAKK